MATAKTKIVCRAFDSFAPAHSASGLPVYVARYPPAPFCETPFEGASDTDALQLDKYAYS